MGNGKYRAIWDLLWSKNWAVVCDRNTSANVRISFSDSVIRGLRDLSMRLDNKKSRSIK